MVEDIDSEERRCPGEDKDVWRDSVDPGRRPSLTRPKLDVEVESLPFWEGVLPNMISPDLRTWTLSGRLRRMGGGSGGSGGDGWCMDFERKTRAEGDASGVFVLGLGLRNGDCCGVTLLDPYAAGVVV